ncbi:hypothetical protein LCGC14_0359960 [marine sediment metagenome]|uniref:Uncharacterized protein n=1 Tax=marine sediment metagenome TaxID=412755 RepID=A0A0F9TR70_9ZZZZ
MRKLFPLQGIDKGRATPEQPIATSPDLNNVRPYDTLDNRARGGQRPGLDKLYAQQIGGTEAPIVAMCSVTVVR